MAAYHRVINEENWAEELRPFLNNDHPKGVHIDDFDALLNDIDRTFRFSIRGKRTLNRAIDFADRLKTEYRNILDQFSRYQEGLTNLDTFGSSLTNMINFVEWRDNDLEIPMEDYHRVRATNNVQMDRFVHLQWNTRAEVDEFNTSWKDLLPQLQELLDEVPTNVLSR